MFAALAILTAVSLQPAAPAPAAPLASSTHDQADGQRTLDLKVGETVTLTFDERWRPTIVAKATVDGQALSARMPRPIDPNDKSAAGAQPGLMTATPGAKDAHPLNHAARGTVVMSLAPYSGGGLLLLVEDGLDKPFRYHAATLRRLPDGRSGGRSTSLCPAKPGVGTVESWAQPFDSLLVVRFEAVTDDLSCHD